jgi:predicted GNAT family N-acyltransferase
LIQLSCSSPIVQATEKGRNAGEILSFMISKTATMTQEPQSLRAVEVRQITAAETVPLRHAVLRPGRSVETARFLGDDDETTKHFGAFRNGQLLCIASLFQAELPEEPGIPGLQLRGMATDCTAQGTGLGRALVLACADFTRKQGAQLLWCNARISASVFYSKLGFEIVGSEFHIPDVGPHYRMKLPLDK